jgi:hypothetical protein
VSIVRHTFFSASRSHPIRDSPAQGGSVDRRWGWDVGGEEKSMMQSPRPRCPGCARSDSDRDGYVEEIAIKQPVSATFDGAAPVWQVELYCCAKCGHVFGAGPSAEAIRKMVRREFERRD